MRTEKHKILHNRGNPWKNGANITSTNIGRGADRRVSAKRNCIKLYRTAIE